MRTFISTELHGNGSKTWKATGQLGYFETEISKEFGVTDRHVRQATEENKQPCAEKWRERSGV